MQSQKFSVRNQSSKIIMRSFMFEICHRVHFHKFPILLDASDFTRLLTSSYLFFLLIELLLLFSRSWVINLLHLTCVTVRVASLRFVVCIRRIRVQTRLLCSVRISSMFSRSIVRSLATMAETGKQLGLFRIYSLISLISVISRLIFINNRVISVKSRLDDGIFVITINNPKRNNCVGHPTAKVNTVGRGASRNALIQALVEAFERFEADERAKVAVLHGEGTIVILYY